MSPIHHFAQRLGLFLSFLVGMSLLTFHLNSETITTHTYTPESKVAEIQMNTDLQIVATPTPTPVLIAMPPNPTPTPTPFYTIGSEPSLEELNNINNQLETNIPRWRIRMADNSSQIQSYNCAAWSIFSATDHIYQFGSRSNLVTVILNSGFQSCSSSDPDRCLFIMDTDTNPSAQTVTHVCNRFRGFGPPWDWEPDPGKSWLWESKLGTASYRIIHEEKELVGSKYGSIIQYFKRNLKG
ncbi:MAG: hypothetical protein HPY51_06360 [Candidatus Omnitrophica bacterium]|nr:hypothetical protein [Candidatus Omnitrophota bacterium]